MSVLCKECEEKYEKLGRKFKIYHACSQCKQKQSDKRFIESKALENMRKNNSEPIFLKTGKYFARMY